MANADNVRAIALALPGVVGIDSDGEVGLSDARKAIELSNSRFSEAIRSQDPERVGAFYSEDAVLLVGDYPAARGRDQIIAWFTRAFAGGLADLTFETAEVRPFSDLVIEEGAYRMVIGDADQRGRYLVVHEPAADGAWQVLYDVVQPG